MYESELSYDNLDNNSDGHSIELPQPSGNEKRFVYLPYDKISSAYFNNGNILDGTLTWVLSSKGRNKTPELFNRARVVIDDHTADEGLDKLKNRILVRYPKGSTYRVRKSNILPVLEAGVVTDRIVVVVPDTHMYRKLAVIHACTGESFLEIGCDFGVCVDNVRKALSEVGTVAREDEKADDINKKITNETQDDNKGRFCCIGIDKSSTSLKIAKERFPHTYFSLEDAITDKGTAKIRKLCKEKMIHGEPDVVAVDINGNREVSAVLSCIKQILQPGKDVTVGKDWNLPRLIIVKSSNLYQAMVQ